MNVMKLQDVPAAPRPLHLPVFPTRRAPWPRSLIPPLDTPLVQPAIWHTFILSQYLKAIDNECQSLAVRREVKIIRESRQRYAHISFTIHSHICNANPNSKTVIELAAAPSRSQLSSTSGPVGTASPASRQYEVYLRANLTYLLHSALHHIPRD